MVIVWAGWGGGGGGMGSDSPRPTVSRANEVMVAVLIEQDQEDHPDQGNSPAHDMIVELVCCWCFDALRDEDEEVECECARPEVGCEVKELGREVGRGRGEGGERERESVREKVRERTRQTNRQR